MERCTRPRPAPACWWGWDASRAGWDEHCARGRPGELASRQSPVSLLSSLLGTSGSNLFCRKSPGPQPFSLSAENSRRGKRQDSRSQKNARTPGSAAIWLQEETEHLAATVAAAFM